MKSGNLIALWACGTLTIVAAVAATWTLWPHRGARLVYPSNEPEVAVGEGAYRQYCASCHGAKFEGQPNWMSRKPDGRLPAPPHDETGHTWHHPDEQLFQMTKHGMKPPLAPEGYQSDMPAFEGQLSDEQIRAVIAYIKSQWPSEIRERQRRYNEAYRQR